eukprot:1004425-Prymnesium_polylepis.2
MAGNNTLKGAADLGVVHVLDVVRAAPPTSPPAAGPFDGGGARRTLARCCTRLRVAKLGLSRCRASQAGAKHAWREPHAAARVSRDSRAAQTGGGPHQGDDRRRCVGAVPRQPGHGPDRRDSPDAPGPLPGDEGGEARRAPPPIAAEGSRTAHAPPTAFASPTPPRPVPRRSRRTRRARRSCRSHRPPAFGNGRRRPRAQNMNMASGVPGQARKIDASRSVAELGLQLRDLKTTLKDAVESMVANGHVRATPATRVLHLLGSPASSYYEKLSVMYAQGCVASNVEPCAAEGYDFAYAVVHPEGPSWSFPADLSADAMASAPRLDNGSGLARLAALGADVCQSHMFCVQGVSTYRAILDLLNVPYLGGSVDAMTLTTHKGRSRDVVLAAGVPCAEGEVLRHGASPSMAPPYVLKPCSEDNSMGISLVMEPSQAEAALEKAYSFDDEVWRAAPLELARCFSASYALALWLALLHPPTLAVPRSDLRQHLPITITML